MLTAQRPSLRCQEFFLHQIIILCHQRLIARNQLISSVMGQQIIKNRVRLGHRLSVKEGLREYMYMYFNE